MGKGSPLKGYEQDSNTVFLKKIILVTMQRIHCRAIEWKKIGKLVSRLII